MSTLGQLLAPQKREIHTIDPRATVYDAIAKMEKLNIGALLVMLEHRVKGIFTERDYLRKVMLQGRSSKTTEVGQIMTTKLVVATVDLTVHQGLAIMTDARCRHLPVFDKAQLVALLSIGDLVKEVIRDQKAEIRLLTDYVHSR